MSKLENFQFLSNLFFIKIRVFGAKIQTNKDILTLENYQKSLIFSSKIEFSDTTYDFMTVCKHKEVKIHFLKRFQCNGIFEQKSGIFSSVGG